MKKGINSKTPTNKKIAVEDLFAAAQNKFRTSESAQSTLLVYDGKIDHPDGISSDYSDGEEDDFSLKSSSRSQFWYGKQGKLYAASDNTSVSSSDSTSTTTSRYITPKELVHEITYRVQNHLAPPEYVRRMDELPPHLLSWNNRVSSTKTSNTVPINIIGCHQPIELLIAKANQRQRHERRVRHVKTKKLEEKVKEIHESIQAKFSRAERYAAILEEKQRQVSWLKILSVTLYMRRCEEVYRIAATAIKRFKSAAQQALRIHMFFLNYYHRRIFRKYKLGFIRALGASQFLFRFRFRIWRKKRAVTRMLSFLRNLMNKRKQLMSNAARIHLFLVAVRKIQRCFRSLRAVKNAKVAVLSKIWLKIETSFISKMLRKREAKKKRDSVADSKIDFDLFDPKTRIEMKNQARKWTEIDSQMEEFLARLKMRRIIGKESAEDIMTSLMVPERVRLVKLRRFVANKRREFFAHQKDLLRKQMHLLANATFQVSDAADLLKGRNMDHIHSLITEKALKKTPHLKFEPFYFFRSIEKNAIFNLVEEAHREMGTFSLKTDTDRSSNHGAIRRK